MARVAPVRFASVRRAPVRFAPARLAPLKPGLGQVHPAKGQFGMHREAAEHGDGGLDVDRGSIEFIDVLDRFSAFLLGWLRLSIFWKPGLVLVERSAVHPDEGAQDLDDGGLVSVPTRVVRNLLQGVDAAQADIEVVVAELLDGLGVAVGEMPSLGQFEGASGDPIDPAVQPEGSQGAQPNEPRQERCPRGGDGVEPNVLGILSTAGGPVQRRHTLPPQPHEPAEQQHDASDAQHRPDGRAPTPPRTMLVCHGDGCTACPESPPILANLTLPQ
jgi:hypothetical protein